MLIVVCGGPLAGAWAATGCFGCGRPVVPDPDDQGGELVCMRCGALALLRPGPEPDLLLARTAQRAAELEGERLRVVLGLDSFGDRQWVCPPLIAAALDARRRQN